MLETSRQRIVFLAVDGLSFYAFVADCVLGCALIRARTAHPRVLHKARELLNFLRVWVALGGRKAAHRPSEVQGGSRGSNGSQSYLAACSRYHVNAVSEIRFPSIQLSSLVRLSLYVRSRSEEDCGRTDTTESEAESNETGLEESVGREGR